MAIPLQDVDDVLTDPDFLCSFDVLRSTQTMVGGRAVDVGTTTSGVLGVVFPDRGRTLQRMGMPGEKQIDSISIVTKFRLTAGASGASLDADVVTWNGARYTVVAIRDWEYGQGFVEATADMLDYVHL